MRRRFALIGLLVAGALVLAGCVSVPDSGPVVTVERVGDPEPEEAPQHDPLSPQRGDTRVDTVIGFIEAMRQIPISTTVAREYLTDDASDGWHPEEGYLSFEDFSRPDDLGNVLLRRVNRFDSRGLWQGPGPGARGDLSVRFPLTLEDGQWRIRDAPDALMVEEEWFADKLRPLSLYYFDPLARVLVPEPVFLPAGLDQTPTMLIRGLLEGPVNPRVERTYIPEGTTLDLAVTVKDGVAEVPLSMAGNAGEVPRDTVDLMAAQIAWTLRQVREIRRIRLTVDGDPLLLSGDRDAFGVEAGFDPTGEVTPGKLYGLKDGVAVRVSAGGVRRVPGPFGRRAYGLRTISVDLRGAQIAGVTTAGTDVILARINDSGDGPRSVLSGGEDLLAPRWDVQGRLWVVDRQRGGASVAMVAPSGRSTVVEVPGVTGEAVTDFLVSRDGTRLVALVDGPRFDRVLVTRIVAPDTGHRLRAVDPRVIVRGPRLLSIGWRTPISIVYLQAVGSGESAVVSAIVDGSPRSLDLSALEALFPASYSSLVTSPRETETGYLEDGGDGTLSPILGTDAGLPAGMTSLTYAG